MRVIALDAMGGDLGPTVAVTGARAFVKSHPDFKVILVGDKAQLEPLLATTPSAQISIKHAPLVVTGEASLSLARRSDSSMAVALALMANNEVGGVISAGNSGVFFTSAALNLKRLDGVRRAAFMTITPSVDIKRYFLLLDVGANLEVSSEVLVQWASLGVAFASAILKREKPQVGLVNIGTEETKGLANVQEAHVLLKASNLNYYGYVEPRDLLKPLVDVAIIDGYGGNIVLKTIEGTTTSLMQIIKNGVLATSRGKLGGALLKPMFSELRDRFDYRHNGGAWVIGFDGVVIKAHGASDEVAFESALALVANAINNKVVDAFKAQLKLVAPIEGQ